MVTWLAFVVGVVAGWAWCFGTVARVIRTRCDLMDDGQRYVAVVLFRHVLPWPLSKWLDRYAEWKANRGC